MGTDPQVNQPDAAASREPRTESRNTDPLSSASQQDYKNTVKGGNESSTERSGEGKKGYDPVKEKERAEGMAADRKTGTSKFA